MSDAEAAIRPMEVAGNRLTLLADGPERLEALIGLIDGAEESLRILYYIWENDESGRRVRDALVAAAERGVAVSLLVDGFGASRAAFLRAPGRRRGALLPVRAALGAALSA